MYRKGYIYAIINKINGKTYYGKTFNIEKRWAHHIKKATEKINRRLYDSMNYYGYNNFSIHKISEIEKEKEFITKKLNELEKYFIKFSGSQNPKFGYNMTEGGDRGDTLSNHPDKTSIIEKRRIKNLGKKRSEEFCQKISEITQFYFKNIDPTILKERTERAIISKNKRIKEIGFSEKEIDAHKLNAKRLSDYNKSKEGKETISKLMKGKKKPAFTEDHRKNIGKASTGRKIPGKNISIENKKYESLHEASRILEIPLMTIRNRLINKKFSDWIYLDK